MSASVPHKSLVCFDVPYLFVYEFIGKHWQFVNDGNIDKNTFLGFFWLPCVLVCTLAKVTLAWDQLALGLENHIPVHSCRCRRGLDVFDGFWKFLQYAHIICVGMLALLCFFKANNSTVLLVTAWNCGNRTTRRFTTAAECTQYPSSTFNKKPPCRHFFALCETEVGPIKFSAASWKKTQPPRDRIHQPVPSCINKTRGFRWFLKVCFGRLAGIGQKKKCTGRKGASSS